MITYNPKDASVVWPAGDYTATIEAVEEKTSKAGNDMHALTFTVYNGDRAIHVAEYIVYPAFTWKLKKLAVALGAVDTFHAGRFDPADFIGRNLTVTLGIEDGKDGYDEKNKITAYKPKLTDPKRADLEPEPPIPEDLPF